jgi:hypothetical protein
MNDSIKRLEEIKKNTTPTKLLRIIDAFIQSEQSRYMSIGHNPETAVKMAISRLEGMMAEE